jgi:hypothetical protein
LEIAFRICRLFVRASPVYELCDAVKLAKLRLNQRGCKSKAARSDEVA